MEKEKVDATFIADAAGSRFAPEPPEPNAHVDPLIRDILDIFSRRIASLREVVDNFRNDGAK